MNPKPQPLRPVGPRSAKRLLQWLHPADTLEEVEGDLDELYTHWYRKAGKTKATFWYLLNGSRCCPPLYDDENTQNNNTNNRQNYSWP